MKNDFQFASLSATHQDFCGLAKLQLNTQSASLDQIDRRQDRGFDVIATLGEQVYVYQAKTMSRPGLELQDGELRKYLTELRNLEAHGDISRETSLAWRAGSPFRWALSIIGHAYRAWNTVEPVQVSGPSILNSFGIPSSSASWQNEFCGTPGSGRSSGLEILNLGKSHLQSRPSWPVWMAKIPGQYWGAVSAPPAEGMLPWMGKRPQINSGLYGLRNISQTDCRCLDSFSKTSTFTTIIGFLRIEATPSSLMNAVKRALRITNKILTCKLTNLRLAPVCFQFVIVERGWLRIHGPRSPKAMLERLESCFQQVNGRIHSPLAA